MVKVLIPTKPDDNDAIFVKLALEKKGHQCVIWYTADFPQKQTHSFELFDNTVYWNASGIDFHVDENDRFDVVWLRRPRQPHLSEAIHADDIANVKNENMALYKTFWRVIAPNAFWVNPINGVNTASCKLLQLKLAMEAGLNIPDTLFSNNPDHIREFIKRYHNKDVIYKTLHPLIWLNDEELRLTYTSEIKLENLPSDQILQQTPGIFQNKIPKQFELRITYFGNHAVAAKIHSQQHEKGLMDWRSVPPHSLKVEPFELPDSIDKKCRMLMDKLGIVMGCFDFIVTPDNEYYFLEVNEQGQFLWVEEANPEIQMLEYFCEFLINRSLGNERKKSASIVGLSDFRSQAFEIRTNAIDKHIKPDDRF